MNFTPRVGELYRHYKNGLYQILTVARHSQTREEYVVYQALQGDFRTYVEPLALFTKEINHAKYPEVTQDYRFIRIDRAELLAKRPQKKVELPEKAEVEREKLEKDKLEKEENTSHIRKAAPARFTKQYAEQMPPSETEREYEQKRQRQMEEREQRREQFKKPTHTESATDELQANPNLLKFLDTDTYEEKYQVLMNIRDEVTDRLIDDIAVVLDVVIPEGELSERFAQLKNIILTRQRFEQNRLR